MVGSDGKFRRQRSRTASTSQAFSGTPSHDPRYDLRHTWTKVQECMHNDSPRLGHKKGATRFGRSSAMPPWC